MQACTCECGHLGLALCPVNKLGRLFPAADPATCAAYFSGGDLTMRALIDVILLALQLYIYVIIAAAVLSWLIAFNVVNTRNQAVAMIGDFLFRLTEPVFRPIRNLMPNLGGIDLSPVIVILLIILIERILIYYVAPNVF